MKAVHHLTVDVEEYFHSTQLTSRLSQEDWDGIPRRSPTVVHWLLEELASRGARGTFFILGWLAEREPGLVKAIAAAGHEVASHSWCHREVNTLRPLQFRRSVRHTKDLLEQLTGMPVEGYRAPSFSITPGCEWAFDVLLEEGYRYDSSLFPMRMHPTYGYPDTPGDPYWLHCRDGRLLEVPLLTMEVWGQRFPAAGGAYLRLLPARLVDAGLRQADERHVPGTIYIHPWDMDPDGSTIPLHPMLRLRLSGGRERCRIRLLRLLDQHTFVPVAETLERMQCGSAG